MVYLAHFLLEELAGGMRGLGQGPRGRWATNEVGDPWGFRSPLYSGISWDCEGRLDPGGQGFGQSWVAGPIESGTGLLWGMTRGLHGQTRQVMPVERGSRVLEGLDLLGLGGGHLISN